MFNLRFIFVFASLCALISAGHAIADTEISGAVSGVWTREGNPYFVVDSTWVPEGETLRIGPGVNILFDRDTGLWAYGCLNAIGAEEDSIRFLPHVVNNAWKGITLIGQPEQHVFDYCVLNGAPEGISLRDRIRLNILHSVIDCEFKAIGADGEGFFDSGVILIENSVLFGSECIRRGCWINLTVNNSVIHKNIWMGGCRISATGSVLYDHIKVDYGDYTDCQFLLSEGTDHAYVYMTGIMEDCYSESEIRIQHEPCVITNLESTGAVTGESNLLIDSCNIRYLNVRSDRHEGEGDITVLNSTIYDEMNVSSTGLINFINCKVFGDCTIRGDNATITIDSCEFHTSLVDEYYGLLRFRAYESSVLDVKHSLFTIPIIFTHLDSITFVNNTCIYTPRLNSYLMSFFDTYTHIVMKNNIFFSDYEESTFINSYAGDTDPHFQYNMIYDFDRLFLHEGNEDYSFEIDSTNYYVDPQFVCLDSLNYHLLDISPCIDAGDPDSPLDPDGTRADIGAYYFHHGNCVDDNQINKPSILKFQSAYPNPFNNAFNIMLPPENRGSVLVSIFDMNGRKIFQTNHSSNAGVINVDASKFPTGEYLIHLKSDKFSQTIPVSCLK